MSKKLSLKEARKRRELSANKVTVPERKPEGEKRALILDGDIFAYQAVEVAQQEVCNDREEWTYLVDMKVVKEEMRTRIEELMRDLEGDKIYIAFGAAGNWRMKVMPEYKAHRKGKRKPLGYFACVDWMRKEWFCETRPMLEADDVVGIAMTDKSCLRDYVKIAVSEDKDFKQIPGLLYNPRKPELGIVKTTKAEANHFHMVQTLTGDTADGYKGCPGIGVVKAELVLQDGGVVEGMLEPTPWQKVVEAFKSKKLSEAVALENARVARIMRVEDLDDDGKVILWKPRKIKKG